MKRIIKVTVATVIAGAFAFGGHLSAHTNESSATCAGLNAVATNFEDVDTNAITVSIDGSPVASVADFGTGYNNTFQFPQDGLTHTWSVVIDSSDNTWDSSVGGTVGPCGEETTTTQGETTSTSASTTSTLVDTTTSSSTSTPGPTTSTGSSSTSTDASTTSSPQPTTTASVTSSTCPPGQMEHHPGHCVPMMTEPPTTPPSTSPTSPGELPHTGAGGGMILTAALGGVLIASGSTLTLIVRRLGRK